ncbi:MAG: GIY-YIG nuclease family protein [Gemmataceae bacterium]
MHGLFPRPVFTGFGPFTLTGQEPPLAGGRGRSTRLRGLVRRFAPHLPGVYGLLDAHDQLLYVGKARSLRSRLQSYFVPSRSDKAAAILREARRLVWETLPDEFAALLRELELIRRWRPRWNVWGQPQRQRRVYLCLGREPAGYAFVSANPPTTARGCWGPLPGYRQSREACDRLNDWYRLRDCPDKQVMRFSDQNELFPVSYKAGCIRHELGACLAPCAAACTRQQYAFHVAAARDFLDGRDRTPLEQLQRQIRQAAAELQFERAAALLERLERLEWLWRHLERLREARQISGIYTVPTAQGGQTWYGLKHGVVRRVVSVPTDPVHREKARAELLQFLAGSTALGVPALHEIDGVLLVCSWFRRFPEQRRAIEPLPHPECRQLETT